MSDRISKLHSLGQSIWYDNIQRRLLENGELEELIRRGDIRGVTSNPSIFNNAIAKTNDYDTALIPMAWAGWPADQIFYELAIEEIRAAADLFEPLFSETGGGDGYVSLEVSPFLAQTTEGTVAEAKRLWQAVNRPNLMIKIPATLAGIHAVEQTIAEGINVNVTLIFSLVRYAEVMQAYLRGLEQRAALGQPVGNIASVASFFVSRVDTKVDQRLQTLERTGGAKSEIASRLYGKAAIANAKLAYAQFLEVFNSERFQRLRELGARVQRPLWASTSTKNPDYRDVIYVEELIGPDTVNTVPPQTLDAFRDHGEARLSLTEDLDQARQTVAELESLGISMDRVTLELEEEGVKAFSDAFSSLLKAIEDRRAVAGEQLGPLQADVRARVGQLEKDSYVPRLFNADPTLWTQDPAGQAEVRRRLGWLDLPITSRASVPEYEQFRDDVLAAGFSRVLLLGMGGSSLAPEVFSRMGKKVLCEHGTKALELTILDSTDPGQVRAADRQNPVEKTLFIVSSKSGTTSEINAYFDFFWAKAVTKLGVRAGSHFVAITDPGTALEKLGREREFRRVFLANSQVGGRYSALTAFGLVPACLSGLDLNRLLDSAAWMARQCAPEVIPGRNPGLVLGAMMGEAALQGRDKLTFLTTPDWEPFGAWLEQLVAESSGKQGRGILPVAGEPVNRPGRYGRDRLFVSIQVNGAADDRLTALQNAGHPVIRFSVKDVYDLGAEIYRWEFATATACSILGINAFDQPDVQDNKTRTAAMISEFSRSGCLPEPAPIWEADGICVYGHAFPGMERAGTIADVLRAFLEQGNPADFVAINAYLPRDDRNEYRLRRLRKKIGQMSGLATTLGFGPRFLHSTGQYHKGGPNKGLFIEITTEPKRDLDIPGAPVSFKTLEQAQALGDLEALLARDRRAIRINIPEGDVRRLS